MQSRNHFSFQRFQLNGGRQGRSIAGPFAMVIAVVMFIILLGATIVGSVVFMLIRSVLRLVGAIGETIFPMTRPFSKQSRPAPSRQKAHKPEAESAAPAEEAVPTGVAASSPPKTISLQKDASGAWRSQD